MAFEAGGLQGRVAAAVWLVNSGLSSEQQPHAVAMTMAAGGVQRCDTAAICLVDGGVRGE
eukprot:scaffold18079_cov65-Phaeocystis_antarctica.AAC.11